MLSVVIGSDHAGYLMKQEIIKYIEEKGYKVSDEGTYDSTSVDYPDYANKVVKKILSDNSSRGILICGTGIGISIAANRHKGIRAALCHDAFTAKMSRLHNDANILVFGANTTGIAVAKDMIDIWFDTSFEGGRHINRINKLDK